MKHKSYIDMLYLYKEGELKEKEKSALQKHISECSSCAEEAKRVTVVKSISEKLSHSIPEFIDEEIFTDELMKKIIVSKTESGYGTPSVVYKIIDFLSYPISRIALTSILVIIIASFVYETTVMVSGITRLEKKAEHFSGIKVKSASMIQDDPEFWNTLSNLYKFYSKQKGFTRLSSEWILIDQTSLKQLLNFYGKLNYLSENLPAGFEKQYPELYTLLQDKTSIEELSIKLENKEVLQELENLLNKGEKENVE